MSELTLQALCNDNNLTPLQMRKVHYLNSASENAEDDDFKRIFRKKLNELLDKYFKKNTCH